MPGGRAGGQNSIERTSHTTKSWRIAENWLPRALSGLTD